MKREIIYPAIYKHFKGKYYATIGISEPLSNITDSDSFEYLKATHTETYRMIQIVKDAHGNFAHYEHKECKRIVLYKSLYDDTGVYARPLEMFAGKVDKEKYPEIKQEFRFELVRY